MISILAPLSAAIMSAVAPDMVSAQDLEGPSSTVIQQSEGGGFIIVSRTPEPTALREFIVVVSTVFVAVILGGLGGWCLVGALLLFIPWKRTKPRGFIPHLAWRWGLLRLPHYPGPNQTRFYE